MEFSISDVIRQNTLGQSEGFPAGVPHSWNWYQGWSDDGLGVKTPPADFTAVEGWGQVYQQEGAPAYTNPDATVEVANAKTYVRIKQTGEWVVVQDQSKAQLTGGHFVADFAGNAAKPAKVTPLAGGGTSFSIPPTGHNDHFWYGSRGTYTAGTVDAVYVQMDMRVTDPNLNLVASVGVDWWRDAKAPYLQDHSNNPGVGSSNWIKLSTEWKTLGYYSVSTTQFQSDPPPPLLGSVNTPPTGPNPDITAPATPKITAFTPDTGTIGDRITSASVLTLTGTAEAGSTVKVFDGAAQIGTAKANASGIWSFTTGQLSNAIHEFTATATDTTGNASSASSLLTIEVDTAKASPSAPPPSGKNPLVKGSFEAPSVGTGEWAGFGNGGVHQTVQTATGRSDNLSLDPHSRLGFTGSTTTVLWNDQFLFLALLFGAMIKIHRNASLDRPRKGATSIG